MTPDKYKITVHLTDKFMVQQPDGSLVLNTDGHRYIGLVDIAGGRHQRFDSEPWVGEAPYPPEKFAAGIHKFMAGQPDDFGTPNKEVSATKVL